MSATSGDAASCGDDDLSASSDRTDVSTPRPELSFVLMTEEEFWDCNDQVLNFVCYEQYREMLRHERTRQQDVLCGDGEPHNVNFKIAIEEAVRRKLQRMSTES